MAAMFQAVKPGSVPAYAARFEMAPTARIGYLNGVPDDADHTITHAEDERILRGLREEIGGRVRPFVTHLDPAAVDALIDQMARIRFKYDGAGALRHAPGAGVRRFDF
jgi:hypothetical protein